MLRGCALALLGVVVLVACETSPPMVAVRSPPAAQAPVASASAQVTAPASNKPRREMKLAEVGLDATALDRSVNACDDFYQFACGGWLARTSIPDDRSKWGRSFSEIAQRTEGDLHALVQAAASSDRPERRKVGDYFAACMNVEALDKLGDRPLQPLFAQIGKVRDAASLARTLGDLHRQRIWPLFDISDDQDFKDATQVIATLDQNGLGLPDRDNYLDQDDKAQALRQTYTEHVERMMRLVGLDKTAAKAAAKDVLAVETQLARAAMSRVDRREPKNLYHRINRDGLVNLVPNLPWDEYFKALGAPDLRDINVTSPAFFTEVNTLVKQLRPAQWQTYLRWHVARSLAPQLGQKFVDESFTLDRAISGQTRQRDRWKRCVDATDQSLGELLAQPFVEAKFGPESKKAVETMVFAIRDAFGRELGQLDWMDETTRTRARAKLAQMEYLIGYPAKWRSYDFTVDPKDHVKNVLAARSFDEKRRLGKVGKPLDRGEWLMTPPTVNAYYDPLKNQMVFPAGILQPPFYSPKASVAVNMGAMGMVVGHELTHGFDDEGSRFAGNGNLEEWWTPAVREKFDRKGTCVADQYGAYEPLPGLKLNGRLTLGENIADMGGVKLAYAAYRSLRQDAPEQIVAEGFTEDQQFFLSVGQVWCSKARDEQARTAVKVDPHSPPRFRVNGSLADLPEFGRAFACAPSRPMTPANACEVW